jgi:hypothetical protein
MLIFKERNQLCARKDLFDRALDFVYAIFSTDTLTLIRIVLHLDEWLQNSFNIIFL